jgi:predicted transcriptional regulator
MNYSNVKGHTDFIRDNSTGAILNNNSSEYDNYLKRRAKRQQGEDRIDNMEDDLKSLKDDINEIKTLLRALSNG